MEAHAYIPDIYSNSTTHNIQSTNPILPDQAKTYEPILAISLLYAALLLSYSSKSFSSFRKNHYTLVAVHTISNIVELAQFYSLPYRYKEADERPVPLASLLLCLIQVQTNFALVRRLRRGNPAIVRTTYQGAGILRAATMIPAYFLQCQTLYHDSVVIIHAFVYARLIIWLFSLKQSFPNIEISELDSLNGESAKAVAKQLYEESGANKTLVTTQQAYTAGIYGSALIVIGHQQDEIMRRFGNIVFLGVMALLMYTEQWVGDIVVDYLKGQEMATLKQKFAWKLYEIGFCRLPVLLQVDKAVTTNAKAKN